MQGNESCYIVKPSLCGRLHKCILTSYGLTMTTVFEWDFSQFDETQSQWPKQYEKAAALISYLEILSISSLSVTDVGLKCHAAY